MRGQTPLAVVWWASLSNPANKEGCVKEEGTWTVKVKVPAKSR